MTDYKPGEVVDITIRGVRIARPRMATSVTITDEHGVTYQMPPHAVVERVAPAAWPPRPGDLWRDRRSYLWFAADIHDIEETDQIQIGKWSDWAESYDIESPAPKKKKKIFSPLEGPRLQDMPSHPDHPGMYADLSVRARFAQLVAELEGGVR